jgi:hypothetical protein
MKNECLAQRWPQYLEQRRAERATPRKQIEVYRLLRQPKMWADASGMRDTPKMEVCGGPDVATAKLTQNSKTNPSCRIAPRTGRGYYEPDFNNQSLVELPTARTTAG